MFGYKFYVFESDFCWFRRLKCLVIFWLNFYSSHSEQWEVKKNWAIFSASWKLKQQKYKQSNQTNCRVKIIAI